MRYSTHCNLYLDNKHFTCHFSFMFKYTDQAVHFQIYVFAFFFWPDNLQGANKLKDQTNKQFTRKPTNRPDDQPTMHLGFFGAREIWVAPSSEKYHPSKTHQEQLRRTKTYPVRLGIMTKDFHQLISCWWILKKVGNLFSVSDPSLTVIIQSNQINCVGKFSSTWKSLTPVYTYNGR